MSREQRQTLKQLISDRVRGEVEQNRPNPLSSVADTKKSTIGSTFLAELPRRTQRRSIFGAIIEYEGSTNLS